MCVCVCVLDREREREKGRGGGGRERTVSFPRPVYPKIHLSVLQTDCVRIFRFMIGLFSLFCLVLRFFCGCTTNQSRQKSVKGQFYYHISFKNNVRTHIFNKTDVLQNWYTMTLGRLYFGYFTTAKVPSASAKVVLDKRPYKISSKAMHRVCCFRWWRHVISRTADVWSELVSLVSSIRPPLPRFRAVTCYRPLCLQTRHMWRWLTSVKQNRCSLV